MTKQEGDVAGFLNVLKDVKSAEVAGSRFLDSLVLPALLRRRNSWFEQFASRLLELSERDVRINAEMLRSDAFLDLLMQAACASVRTSSKWKCKVLQNAVLNFVKPGLIQRDESLHAMLIAIIDELSPLHLKFLVALDDHRYSGSVDEGHMKAFFAQLVPNEVTRAQQLPVVIADLASKRLIHTTGRLAGPAISEISIEGLDPLGRALVEIATDPLKSERGAESID